jgi:anti-sigma factor RsiW
MRCAEAREPILTADPQELESGAAGPLAEHLGECAACRRSADRILAAHQALRTALVPVARSAAAAQRALAEGRRAVRVHRRLRTLAPALAAAAMLVVLLARADHTAPAPVILSHPETMPPLVEAGAARVAIFSTSRPNVTVVWQF